MWTGYLALGGLEIGNNARAIGYATTSGCPLSWFNDDPCPGFLESVGLVGGYEYDTIDTAPWYDPDSPEISGDFLGVFIIRMDNISDSTRSATVSQRIQSGGHIGEIRDATRQVRIQALLSARSAAALEAGRVWLDASLTPGACGSHGTACGTTDLAFFDDCPPERGLLDTDEEYLDRVDDRRRFLHSVACVSGPFTVDELISNDGIHVGRIVEFTIEAEVPYIYGVTRTLPEVPVIPLVIEDVIQNLIQTPSAEVAADIVVVRRNFSTNPSLEANATGWSAVAAPLSGQPAVGTYYTQGRFVGELAAVDTAAWRSRILGNGSTAVTNAGATVTVGKTDALPALDGQQVSLTVWAAGVNFGGASSGGVSGITAQYTWLTGSTPIGSPVAIPTTDTDITSGVTFRIGAQTVPSGATNVKVEVIFAVNWYSSATPANNSDIRMYVDALGVLQP